MAKKGRWNSDKMFFLTRDGDITITDYPTLYTYGNQCLLAYPRPDTPPDKFGRNYIDRLFIQLCGSLHAYYCMDPTQFKSLAAWHDGVLYRARLVTATDTYTDTLAALTTLVQQFPPLPDNPEGCQQIPFLPPTTDV